MVAHVLAQLTPDNRGVMLMVVVLLLVLDGILCGTTTRRGGL